MASPGAVDRALKSIGVSRDMIEGPPAFIPYALQAAFGENIARHLGERHLGAMLVSQYGYEDLGVYARYVLDAPRLDTALARGIKALPFLQSGSIVSLRDAGDSIVLQFSSGIQSAVGACHIDEGTPLLVIDLARHFIGCSWQPEWLELSDKPIRGHTTLESIYEVPIRYGHQIPGIAILKSDFTALNPRARAAQNRTLFSDLRMMVRQRPPDSMAGLVRETLAVAIMTDEPIEEAVAATLRLGKRTMQRQLAAEGYTFREILASFRAERAKELLRETDLSVQEIAASLGYLEVNSFRRAFHSWEGVTPTEFPSKASAKKLA